MASTKGVRAIGSEYQKAAGVVSRQVKPPDTDAVPAQEDNRLNDFLARGIVPDDLKQPDE
jgi:hypothetical protein